MKEYASNFLNERIHEICDNPEEYGYECFGGKTIAYLGWYWRDVDFNSKVTSANFGVSPAGIGFMESNNWGYDYAVPTQEDWDEIRDLVVKVVKDPSKEALKELNAKIQAI